MRSRVGAGELLGDAGDLTSRQDPDRHVDAHACAFERGTADATRRKARGSTALHEGVRLMDGEGARGQAEVRAVGERNETSLVGLVPECGGG